MWCEEINEKYGALTRETPWFFRTQRIAAGAIVRYPGATASNHWRPVPWPARTDQMVDYTLQLLNAFYAKPYDFFSNILNRCDWRDHNNHPIRYPQVRAWMIRNLVSPQDAPAASYFHQDGKQVPPVLQGLLNRLAVSVYLDPSAKAAGGTLNYPGEPGGPAPEELVPDRGAYEDIVTALNEIILVNPVIDRVAWPWLWVWASGGPDGKALFRTRVFALKGLGAIVRRGTVTPTQATVLNLQKLAESVALAGPPGSYQEQRERQLFAGEAAAVVGDVASSLAVSAITVPPALLDPNAYLPPGTTPPWPVWVPVAGAAGALSLLAGILLALRGRQRP